METVSESASTASAAGSSTRGRSFEAFFADEHERLHRALFVLTGSDAEAEEIMQESFIAVWERWDRVGSMDEPTGYLYRVAMNRFRSGLRSTARAARRALRPRAPADPIEGVEQRDILARALAEIPPRQRAAVILTDMLGFDGAGAAKALGVKESTVRSLASQGRSVLRELLENDDA